MKIVKVMEEVGQLQKDGEVIDRQGKKMYNYLSEEMTTGELQKAFVKHKLVMIPVQVETEVIYLESIQYEKPVKTPITKVLVTYEIGDAETGMSKLIQSVGYGSDSQDKGSNKAMTGALKYAQRQTFSISTGDDGDHAPNHELEKAQKPAPTPAPAGIPQTLRVKYKMFKGSEQGMDAWVAAQREKGNDYVTMEKILKEGIDKKNQPAV